jgi:hypothetical protein
MFTFMYERPSSRYTPISSSDELCFLSSFQDEKKFMQSPSPSQSHRIRFLWDRKILDPVSLLVQPASFSIAISSDKNEDAIALQNVHSKEGSYGQICQHDFFLNFSYSRLLLVDSHSESSHHDTQWSVFADKEEDHHVREEGQCRWHLGGANHW